MSPLSFCGLSVSDSVIKCGGRFGILRNEANIIKYQLAVAELRNSDDRLKLAHAVRHLGDAYFYAGEKTLAEPHYVEALSIYRSHDDRRPLDLANAIRSYAVLQAELDAPDEAKSLWQEAHDLYLLLDVQAGVAESAARLALLAQRENDLQRSREWLAEASEAGQVANDPETSRFVAEVKAQIEASQHRQPWAAFTLKSKTQLQAELKLAWICGLCWLAKGR